jgi:hypothetical protein
MAIWTIESKLPAHLDHHDYTPREVARIAKQIASAPFKEDLAARCDFVLCVGDTDLDTLAEMEDDEEYCELIANTMNRIGVVVR